MSNDKMSCLECAKIGSDRCPDYEKTDDACEDFVDVHQALEEAMAEVEMLKCENDQLVSNTFCAYCGEEFPLDTVTAEQVSEHIRTCDKHPIQKINMRRIALEEVLSLCVGLIESACPDAFEWTNNIADKVDLVLSGEYQSEADRLRRELDEEIEHRKQWEMEYEQSFASEKELLARADAAEARVKELEEERDRLRELIRPLAENGTKGLSIELLAKMAVALKGDTDRIQCFNCGKDALVTCEICGDDLCDDCAYFFEDGSRMCLKCKGDTDVG